MGNMLALSADVGYIHEPFSVLHRPGVCDAPFRHWFPYVCSENETEFVAPVRDMLVFRYKTGAELRALRTPRDAARMARDRVNFARWRRRATRPLVKDPLAVFSAEWLADRFDMQVVVVVRHPAAFASSVKKLGWTHPFNDFLSQPLLMRHVLGPFEKEIRQYARSERPPLDQAILLWRLIHYGIVRSRARRPDFIVMRHEDLSRDPELRFCELFARLGLVFDDSARAKVSRFSDPSNPVDAVSPGELRRDSRSGIWNWVTRLTPEEIRQVRDRVEPISRHFYSDEDWEPSLERGRSV